jgi:hypothetical protein
MEPISVLDHAYQLLQADTIFLPDTWFIILPENM